MRLGVCYGTDRAAFALRAGCDYIEMGFASLAGESDEDFSRDVDRLAAAGIRAEAMNCFMPGSNYSVLDPSTPERIAPLFDKGFARAQALGLEVAVFGSAGSRKITDPSMTKEEAYKRMVPFLRLAGDIAAQNGCKVAIETLSPKECNCVNSFREGIRLMEMADHPAVGILADFYHLDANGDSLRDISLAGEKLFHCHIASPGKRYYPLPGQDDLFYHRIAAALDNMGYTGRVSIEGKSDAPETELAESIAFLHTIFG
ncbi:MAG: sugar phosphate isomerase/epimerase [Oscillospiraceae bacterium]|jgi:sugar phosphate isomerase/epimerase|nr:sugar phosphate isomerase/epimerase [Oscillospiraceae bacterium]